MRIAIVTRDLEHASRGNQVTALRWERLFQQLGHRVDVIASFQDEMKCNVLLAIHARKSYESILRFKELYPKRIVVLCLSGTDLQVDMLPQHENGTPEQKLSYRQAIASCEMADRLILLEPYSLKRLPEPFQAKAKVVLQSAAKVELPTSSKGKPTDNIQVCQLAHLRTIKDPFRIVEAALQLPASSNIRIIHAGQAMSDDQQVAAKKFESLCNRYTWLGGLTHETATNLLATSHATVLASRAEGAPSVISEAIVNGVPFIGSRIDATMGLLGSDYPALFDVGNTEQLTELLTRFEEDQAFRSELSNRIADLADRFSIARERDAWRKVFQGL